MEMHGRLSETQSIFGVLESLKPHKRVPSLPVVFSGRKMFTTEVDFQVTEVYSLGYEL